jgi:hypothetical protein
MSVLGSCDDIHPGEIEQQIENLRPLHEEDPHFILYRSLQMESALMRLKIALADAEIDENSKEDIEREIEVLKFNLGI